MSMRDQATRPSAASQQDGSQIDLTPMLDVVFIMLIFFIVTSSFIKEPGIEIFKPQASTTEQCPQGKIIFGIDELGTINYDKKKVRLDEAVQLAQAEKANSPGAQIVIQMDEESNSAVGAELYDKLRSIMTELPCISTEDE